MPFMVRVAKYEGHGGINKLNITKFMIDLLIQSGAFVKVQ